MATATSLIGGGRLNAFDTVAASATNSIVVDNTGTTRKVRVVGVMISCGATASTVQFGSKGAGSTTQISPVFQNSISSAENPKGWFETIAGEDLVVATGAGSNTGILVTYEYITP